jgi:hypothetical protein
VKPARLLLVTVLVVAMVAATSWWGGRDRPEPSSVERPLVPAASAGGDGSRTWYCAAGTAQLPSPPAHSILLTNPGEREVTVRMTPSSPEGAGDPVDVVVPPRTPVGVDVATAFGSAQRSVMVESPEPALVVEHRLVGARGADQALCSTFSSGTWFFPSVNSERGAGALLTLFNPFPGDAGVDIEVGLDTGTRVPTPLSGIVVPARSAVVVDIGQSVQRRERFSLVVRSRSGRVVAELAQSLPAGGEDEDEVSSQGLRLELGVPAPSTRWVIAGGFTGPGAVESLVVQNPGRERLTVTVQVTPYGASANSPEPISLEVPAQRTGILDLSAESRVPGEGYHSITVDSPDGPVVVTRTLTVTDGGAEPTGAGVVPRPVELTRGWSMAPGSPVAALRWFTPGMETAAPTPVLLVHNPGPGVAVVTAESVAAGALAPIGPAGGIEVPAGDSVVISVPALGEVNPPAVSGAGVVAVRTLVGVLVSSGSPVVVERLAAFGPTEFSLGPAAPVALPNGPLEPLAGR